MKTTSSLLLKTFCAAMCIALLPCPSSVRAQDAPEQVYSVGKDVKEPSLQKAEARPSDSNQCQKKLSGKVTFSFVVDANGRPRNIFFVKSLGNDLDKLALAVVEADQFTPATRDGAPVAAGMSVEIKLKGCLVQQGSGAQQLLLAGKPKQDFTQDDSRQGMIQFAPEADTAHNPGAGPAKPYKVEDGVSAPVLLFAPEAKYTNLARRKGISAPCLISLVVDRQGLPRNLHVVQSAGYGLDRNAMNAIERYRFKPAMKDGMPVPVIITVEVNFRLYRKYD